LKAESSVPPWRRLKNEKPELAVKKWEWRWKGLTGKGVAKVTEEGDAITVFAGRLNTFWRLSY